MCGGRSFMQSLPALYGVLLERADTVTKGIQKQQSWSLLFADDIMLASDYRDDLQKQVQSWKLQQHGLRLNVSKTEYMECGVYLGSTVTAKSDIDQEGRARVNVVWMKWKVTTGVLCEKSLSTEVEDLQDCCASCCRVLAGAKTLERVLHAMEMRMLGWTIGVALKIKISNDTVCSVFSVVLITEKVKTTRLRWFGHLLRREENSVVKTALMRDVSCVRPRGRLRIHWLDRVELDIIDAHG
ncbi:hypothetical protein RB195_018845 [Necator americanus]|uniref:Reverse transcriptase domain-containing protein n=1 Tax=Necator americanus TaxID=51031 RepID=A0ABR1CCQ0_NECAM